MYSKGVVAFVKVCTGPLWYYTSYWCQSFVKVCTGPLVLNCTHRNNKHILTKLYFLTLYGIAFVDMLHKNCFWNLVSLLVFLWYPCSSRLASYHSQFSDDSVHIHPCSNFIVASNLSTFKMTRLPYGATCRKLNLYKYTVIE